VANRLLSEHSICEEDAWTGNGHLPHFVVLRKLYAKE